MSTKVFLDIVIGTTAVGRIQFELFYDITPKTSENFRGLCTGEYGNGKITKKKLHYKGTRFHRIVEDQYVQGGDIVYGNGTGGESIYGEFFKDENFKRRHSCAGLLSMANRGRNSNSSQFLITLKPCPHLDDKNVVFGQLIEGMEVVRQMAKVPTDFNERPKIKIIIFDCGDYDTRRLHLKEDAFKETLRAIVEDRKKVEKVKILGPEEAEEYKNTKKKSAFNLIQDYSDEDGEVRGEDGKKSLIIEEGEKELDLNDVGEEEVDDEYYEEEDDLEEKNEEKTLNNLKQTFGNEGIKKFYELKSKINEAINLNIKAVKEENVKSQDPDYDRKKIRNEYIKSRENLREKMLDQGLPEDKFYTTDSINKCENMRHKQDKKHKNEAFGWDVFNVEALYRAHKKRITNMPFDKDLYEYQLKNGGDIDKVDSEERKNLLKNDIEMQSKKRKTFSRRRACYEDQDVDYINDRNRNFNKKLNKFFNKEAAEIKANLERGTAL
jgi:peptidyl-prolyl isomerase G (cyclophilin G)